VSKSATLSRVILACWRVAVMPDGDSGREGSPSSSIMMSSGLEMSTSSKSTFRAVHFKT
jgi:hypothetical protein